MNEVYDTWFRKATELEPGEKLFIPVETSAEQKEVRRVLLKAQATMAASLQEAALSVDIFADIQDKKLWVVLLKRQVSRSVAYMKSLDGSLKKISLSIDEGKRQRIHLMISDGYSLADIEENEGQLTDEELHHYSLIREGDDEAKT